MTEDEYKALEKEVLGDGESTQEELEIEREWINGQIASIASQQAQVKAAFRFHKRMHNDSKLQDAAKDSKQLADALSCMKKRLEEINVG